MHPMDVQTGQSRLIRTFAESQAKPSVVYNLAQIPPPSPPSPAPVSN